MQSKQNNKDYIVGMCVRLSRDDERAGESLSIENQKAILSDYIAEQGWTLYDTYVDDGISGTTFERPGVKRLLDDAKQGVINTILVKDMSRFGRNYIMVGQYLDYVFPTFGIRFVALSDNIDTENKDTPAMDMMPITNVFNEWWAATTSKKLRAVRIKNAKEGKNGMSHPPYGYVIGTDEKRTLQVNEETAPIVKRIFEMRASGLTPRKIADILNVEKVLTPNDYRISTTGINGVRNPSHLWHTAVLRTLLSNQAYIGNLVQHKSTTISYKNHKWHRRPEEEWIIIENAHEAIISKELWDKVKEVEKAVGHGKHTQRGFMHPLSGLMFCADCGAKNAARLEYAERHPVFQLQLQHEIAHGFVCLFQPFHYRTRFRATREKRRRRESRDDYRARSGIQTAVFTAAIFACGQKPSRREERPETC